MAETQPDDRRSLSKLGWAAIGLIVAVLLGGGGFLVARATTDSKPDVAMKAEVETLKGRIAALDAQVTALKDAVATNATGVATNAGKIDTNAAGVKTNASGIATHASRVDALEVAQPFAVTSRTDTTSVSATSVVVAAVRLTAPTAGQVTVTSTTEFNDLLVARMPAIRCSITTLADVERDYLQIIGVDGVSSTQVAGTRMFDIASGATETYNLVCQRTSADASSTLRDSVLTAIFTPAR